jgi:REDY-like protein HapK
METLIILFNLKEGINPADYENFARELKIPGHRALKTVSEHKVFRATALWGERKLPPYQYIEVIEMETVNEYVGDIKRTKGMTNIVNRFSEFTDDSIFILTNNIEKLPYE